MLRGGNGVMKGTQQSSSFAGSGETAALVVEIGCEEIPARFVAGAEHDLGQRLAAALRDARLLEGQAPVKTGSTPRRLVAYVPELRSRQPDRIHQVLGPPVRAAFDQHGRATPAAEAFAAKHRVQVSDLSRIHNAKGEYVIAELPEDGSRALEVLREVLPTVIGGLSFPKSMYWTAKAGPRFVRPIRWILALLGEADNVQAVPFEFAGVHSGSYTFGHRLRGSPPIEITDLNLDLKLMEQRVILRGADRRHRVREQIEVLVEEKELAVPRDAFLEDWAVNSTEWPVSLMGSFDRRYLALPREVLVTVMRGHQKYFAVEDKAGSLQPCFITVLNVPGDPKGLIRQGHERVLAARFADAEFFWNADQKTSLADRIPMLDRVMYHEKIGSYGDKVRRMRDLAGRIFIQVERSGQPAERYGHILRAVELCKCDLTTQMVQEFTELQGVIGGLYAKAQGETAEVANAIYDHYHPLGFDDACPRSAGGAIVSLADKLDSVVSAFFVGLEPTGSSDPFGLRRAGNGIAKIAAEMLPGLQLDLLAAPPSSNDSGPAKRVKAFLQERVEHYLREAAKLRYDTTRAVVNSSLGWSSPSDAVLRGKALEQIIDSPDYRALSQAAKRTRNILSKSGADYIPGTDNLRLDLMTEPEEQGLYRSFKGMRSRLLDLEQKRDYERAFLEVAAMRKPIDSFFDRVLVMADQSDVRGNRLALLNSINAHIFSRLADLSEIAAEGTSSET
jgi:glycyl-tRNA synthetase beta chain